jgi:hypothetical protein
MIQKAAQLTTPANSTPRTKYFPLELNCANMLPNTTYDAYMDGQLVNAFCKPFGGILGGPLTSNAGGRLTFQLMLSVIYKQQYLVNPGGGSGAVSVASAKTLVLIDPFNNSSTFNLPISLQAGP